MSARVSRGSFFGPLVSLKYFNDLADNVASKPLLLADDSSLFSVLKDKVFFAT